MYPLVHWAGIAALVIWVMFSVFINI